MPVMIAAPVTAQAFLVVRFKVSTCVFQVIVGHGEPAPRLCNKDPFALKSLSYLSRIFPKAKFVLMLRDGRATVHSMISRKVHRFFSPLSELQADKHVSIMFPNHLISFVLVVTLVTKLIFHSGFTWVYVVSGLLYLSSLSVPIYR